MGNPKTIKVFLSDGEPTGTKIVELSNWTGISYLIPRARLKDTLTDINNRTDLDSQCVYFLIGENESNEDSIYVGEAEEFSKRITQHNLMKDFWNLVMVFASKDDNLTKAHVKYLESKITQDIKVNNTIKLENANVPPMPKLPRSDIAEMEEFYGQMKVVASALGYTFLEKIENLPSTETLHCTGPNANGKGVLTDDGFYILEGSIARKSETTSFHSFMRNKRKELVNSKAFVENDADSYKLTKNVKFNSPSTASAIILGRNSNGWTDWKNSDGKTLDELKRK